ncbi:MAG: FIST N-terminal domain-containing protein [Burkholderiaceae bacterium]
MKTFLQAHAAHADPDRALAVAGAQLEAQRRLPGRATHPTLGWLYLTDHYAAQAEQLLAKVQQRWPGVAWVGAVGLGVAGGGQEHFDEPALSLMLAELPLGRFQVFSGARPLADFAAHTAQVHADPNTEDLAELIKDMSRRTATGYLFGGLASARNRTLHIAQGVLQGGLSGVAFDKHVALVSRVTQGCQPVGPLRGVTGADRNVITELDGEPALNCLLRDMDIAEDTDAREALPRLRQTLVGLSDRRAPDARHSTRFYTPARHGAFGSDTRVRNLLGLDPARRGVAIGENAEPGLQLTFCTRNTEAARRDLMRICAEIRDEVEFDTMPTPGASSAAPPPSSGSVGIAGAIYVSCTGRGGPHFGAPSAELAVVRRALGDVPLAGFFAAGEIARHHLYGYTGVLTVFRS